MLVLTRRQQESVVVGGTNDIERLLKVTVLAIKGGTVKLGFEARSDIPVHRWEVWERIYAGAGPRAWSAGFAAK
jgi:carbon storage regulator